MMPLGEMLLRLQLNLTGIRRQIVIAALCPCCRMENFPVQTPVSLWQQLLAFIIAASSRSPEPLFFFLPLPLRKHLCLLLKNSDGSDKRCNFNHLKLNPQSFRQFERLERNDKKKERADLNISSTFL